MKHVLAFLLICSTSLAAPPSKILGPTAVDPYKLVELSPDTDTTGSGLIWDVYPDQVADVKEYGQKLVFTGPPGKYDIKLRVVNFADKTITTTRTTVTIGTPPTPVPPTPVPPTPVPPTPNPVPTDPLWPKLKAAYDADMGFDKAVTSQKLSAIYSISSSYPMDMSLTTPKQVHNKLAAYVASALATTQLTGVRRVIGDEMNAVLGTDPNATLNDASRSKMATQFNRMADLLDKLTP